VTNTQIANDLKISVFTVRDKVLKLVKQGYLNSYVDYFDEQNNYVQRKITKGSLEPSIC
jgi:predicted ArsR family transcriptional regulator